MISSGRTSASLNDILDKMSEADILSYYLGITEVPCIINSPLRRDNNPSFGLYSKDGKKIYYIDLATKDSGGVFDLLGKMWNCKYTEVLARIHNDIIRMSKGNIKVNTHTPCTIKSNSVYNKDTDLQCKVREWRSYDIDYWRSYGISLEWLKYAEVYPVSHKIIIKDNQRYILGADKYAYAYVEHKEDKITLKIYQPFNKNGYKWANKHDRSVISLWTKIPEYGDKVVICSSLKDALCLWANTGIPALAVQGEGYNMSDTAILELKRRYKDIYILFDNDKAGLEDAIKLSQQTGFHNLVLPIFEGGKDISDMYKSCGKEYFVNTITSLFEDTEEDNPFDLPF